MRNLFLGLLALGVLAILVWNLRQMETRGVVQTAEARPPRYTVQGADWTRYDETGAPRFRVRAASIDYYDDRSAQVNQIDVALPGGEDSPWNATAPQGEVPAGQERLILTGSVDGKGVWPGGQPLTFKTPTLWIEWPSNRLGTEAGVVIRSDTRNAQAKSMVGNWKDQTLQLSGGVKLDYARP